MMRRALSFLILTCLLVGMLVSCGSMVEAPEIRNGTFDFSVTYEYNGVITTVSGVYVCEYNGVGWVLDGGFYRDWTGYIQNGSEEQIVLGYAPNGDEITLDFCFSPDYFMGDFIEGVDTPPAPLLSAKIQNEGVAFECDANVLAETYGARIINYEYAEPIKNTFR